MNELLKSIVLVGAGGHAKVLIDLISQRDDFEIVGIIDPQLEVGTCFKGIEVLGADERLPQLRNQGIQNVAIGVGSIKCTKQREKLLTQCQEWGFRLPALIHPRSIVSTDVVIQEGVQVMAGAIVQTDTTLGEGTVLNTGVQVDHDCQIGSHVFLAPGAILSGGVSVGNHAFVGAGAVVIQGVRIGENAVVAAGAVVIEDIEAGVLVKGVPAR